MQEEENLLLEVASHIRRRMLEIEGDCVGYEEWQILDDKLNQTELRLTRIQEQMATEEFECINQ